MLKKINQSAALTLVETLTAMAILSVALIFFQAVLKTSWFAYQDRIARANLWQEANEVAEKLTDDGRLAGQIDIATASDGTQSASFLDREDNLFVTYLITVNGELQVDRGGGNVDVLTTHVDSVESFFQKDGKSLIVNLALQDATFSRMARIETSWEVFPRNP